LYVKLYNPQLDVESVEEDNDNITEEETIIQTALSTLDQRSAIFFIKDKFFFDTKSKQPDAEKRSGFDNQPYIGLAVILMRSNREVIASD
jgi:hypothetical protein